MDEKIVSFIQWTKLKIRIHLSDSRFYFLEREIWWTSIGINVGSEQNGKNKSFERPVLILKKFNNSMFLGVPLTRKKKEGRYYFILKSDVPIYVILSQIRVLSSRRLLRRMKKISLVDFVAIKVQIKNFL